MSFALHPVTGIVLIFLSIAGVTVSALMARAGLISTTTDAILHIVVVVALIGVMVLSLGFVTFN